PQLVAVPAIDEAGRVEARDPVAQGQAAAGLHEPGVAPRQRDGDAGGHQRPAAAGRELGVLPSDQVDPRVADTGVGRQWERRIETDDRDGDHAREPTIRPCWYGWTSR